MKRSSGLPWLAWATKANETIRDTDIELECAQDADEINTFCAELQQLLFDCTSGTAWDITNSGGEGNGE